jgi:poly(hydroxyalkanoate) depolymerase family esterase
VRRSNNSELAALHERPHYGKDGDVRSLSDTISRLAAFRAAPGTTDNPVSDRLTDLLDFGSNPGALRGKTYIPEDLPRNAPLVVVLHGCTQTAAGYDYCSGWSRLADRHNVALLYPEQQRSNNANLCFNWFVPQDIRRDAGEAFSIRQMIETLVLRHGIDRERIFVTGLSAGGAMTSVMLATYPDVFAGGAIIAGLPYGCASSVPEAFDRMRGRGFPTQKDLQALLRSASTHTGPWPTISIWHGTADHTVVPSNMAAIIGQWRDVHQVGEMPTHSDLIDGFPHRVWRDVSGRILIEEYSITGMGHGTPIATKPPNNYGAAAPFMLDVGISSTFHIARSWGLVSAEDGRTIMLPHAYDSHAAKVDHLRGAEANFDTSRTHSDAPPIPSAHATSGVRKVIEDALRAAGLMR